MLPIVLPEKDVAALLSDANAGSELEVDLPNQVVRRPNGETISFEVESFRKHCLVEGLDDINLTLTHDEQIRSFESKRTKTWPWLDGVRYHFSPPRAFTKNVIDWLSWKDPNRRN